MLLKHVCTTPMSTTPLTKVIAKDAFRSQTLYNVIMLECAMILLSLFYAMN